jgi:hypothetical protein
MGTLQTVAGKGRACDTYDGERAAVQPHGPADDVLRAVELRLPETMADHDDRTRTLGPLVGWHEGAAPRHRDAEHVEVVGRDVGTRHWHGLGAGAEAEPGQAPDVVGSQPVEH